MSNPLAVILAFDAKSKKWGRYKWDNNDKKLVLMKKYYDSTHAMLAIDTYDRYLKNDFNKEEIEKYRLALAFLSQSAYSTQETR